MFEYFYFFVSCTGNYLLAKTSKWLCLLITTFLVNEKIRFYLLHFPRANFRRLIYRKYEF